MGRKTGFKIIWWSKANNTMINMRSFEKDFDLLSADRTRILIFVYNKIEFGRAAMCSPHFSHRVAVTLLFA